MTDYSNTLDLIASNHFDDWTNISWDELLPLITKDITISQYNFNKSFSDKFPKYNMVTRPRPKNFDRITEKMSYTNWTAKSFKIVADLMAFRISVPVSEIQSVVDYLTTETINNHGKINVREFVSGDIVQFVYIWLPGYGIAEIQIGHPYIFYIFTLSSQIRTMKNIIKPSKYFHENMKKVINGNNPDFNVLENLKKEYNKNEIPSELLTILHEYL